MHSVEHLECVVMQLSLARRGLSRVHLPSHLGHALAPCTRRTHLACCTWSPTSCCMLLLCYVLRTPKCWPTPWPSCTERTAASAAALALHSWPSLAAACREQRRRQLLRSSARACCTWALCTRRCSPCAARPCLLALLDAPARTAAPACLRTTTRPSEIQTKTKRKQRIESKSTSPRARGGKGIHSQRIYGTRSQISITKS